MSLFLYLVLLESTLVTLDSVPAVGALLVTLPIFATSDVEFPLVGAPVAAVPVVGAFKLAFPVLVASGVAFPMSKVL